MDPFVRQAVAVDQANVRLGHETFPACGAIFVRNRALPRIHDANHVVAVRVSTPHEIDTLLARADVEFAHCTHRHFLCDPDTPSEFEARLVLDGYGLDRTLVMLLEGALAGTGSRHAIRPVAEPADWEAYARLKRLDWAERAARLGLGALPDIGEGLIAAYRLKVPPLRYWLALADGTPRGFFSSWEGLEGVGQVEDLFVEAAFRHRGIATALLGHAVADCRAHGAGPGVIAADAVDGPKDMYAAMGFRPVAVIRKYTRS